MLTNIDKEFINSCIDKLLHNTKPSQPAVRRTNLYELTNPSPATPPINCMPPSPPPGQWWGMKGRFSLFCYKMWPQWWGVCQCPFSIDKLKYTDIYLMVFSFLHEKLFSLHCMCKQWISSFYMQTIQSSASTRREGWGFAMKICPWGGEFHI